MRTRALTIWLALGVLPHLACSQVDVAGVEVKRRDLGSTPDVEGAVAASGFPGVENLVASSGLPVANDETAATLGLKPGIKPRGPSIAFSASKPIPPETFEKAQFIIPFTPGPTDKLVVFFRLVATGTEPALTGVIPNTYIDINVTKNTVAFKPRGFGDYQVGYSDEHIIKPFTSETPKVPAVLSPVLDLLGKINYANYHGIEASGETVYLIGDTGLRVVSIANPAVPAQIGLLNNTDFGNGRGIRLAGNLLVQTTNQGGYGAFNITTPTAPTFRGGVGDQQGRDVTLVGTRGFGATSQGIRTFTYQNNIALETLINVTGGCNGVEGDTTLVVFACAQTVLGIVPGNLPNVSISTLDSVLGGQGVAIADSFAYVAGDDGLRIYDILNPLQPRKVGTLAIPGALRVAARGNLAIVLTATQAIAVNVTVKEAPALIMNQESTLPIATGRRVKFLSPDRAIILDSTGLSVLAVRPASSLLP